MSAFTEEPDAAWLTAYALGIAFSVPDDRAACAEILEVTTDPSDFLLARARLVGSPVIDPDTRSRATRLLNRAVSLAEDRRASEDRASKVTG